MIVTLHTPGTPGIEPKDVIIDQLVSLEIELFNSGAWSEAMLRGEFEAPARTYMLDLLDSPDETSPRVRAYGGFWYDGDDAELMTIGVAKPHQGHGLGRSLLAALIERARLLGARRMLLEVRVDNLAALGLYRSCGFVTIGVRKRYYQPQGKDAYTMAFDIAGQRRTSETNGVQQQQRILGGSYNRAVQQ